MLNDRHIRRKGHIKILGSTHQQYIFTANEWGVAFSNAVSIPAITPSSMLLIFCLLSCYSALFTIVMTEILGNLTLIAVTENSDVLFSTYISATDVEDLVCLVY